VERVGRFCGRNGRIGMEGGRKWVGQSQSNGRESLQNGDVRDDDKTPWRIGHACFLINTQYSRRKLHNTKIQQRTNFKGAKLMGARFYKSALNEADFTGTSSL